MNPFKTLGGVWEIDKGGKANLKTIAIDDSIGDAHGMKWKIAIGLCKALLLVRKTQPESNNDTLWNVMMALTKVTDNNGHPLFDDHEVRKIMEIYRDFGGMELPREMGL